MNHEEYVQLQRRRVADLARRILDGQIDVLEGAREIVRLRFEIDVDPDDNDVAAFVAVESETDHLPVGAEKASWSPDALKRKEPELECSREWAYRVVQEECKNLVRRFGNAPV